MSRHQSSVENIVSCYPQTKCNSHQSPSNILVSDKIPQFFAVVLLIVPILQLPRSQRFYGSLMAGEYFCNLFSVCRILVDEVLYCILVALLFWIEDSIERVECDPLRDKCIDHVICILGLPKPTQTSFKVNIHLINIPSWTYDLTQPDAIKDVFLYIDELGFEFLGWDSTKKCPFIISKDTVRKIAFKETLSQEEQLHVKGLNEKRY